MFFVRSFIIVVYIIICMHPDFRQSWSTNDRQTSRNIVV